ncbi:hypothetical protein L204_101566 [Cryptococcus depauperatus]|nr:hypothetical protein L204_04468 [Cryptococcus depauperatus CBS 7855]
MDRAVSPNSCSQEKPMSVIFVEPFVIDAIYCGEPRTEPSHVQSTPKRGSFSSFAHTNIQQYTATQMDKKDSEPQLIESNSADTKKPVPLDIFRRKRDTKTLQPEECVDVRHCGQEIQESPVEPEESSMWGNWSYTMSPVSLLTHLTEEFMIDDQSSSPIRPKQSWPSQTLPTKAIRASSSSSAAARSARHVSGTRSANASRSSSPIKQPSSIVGPGPDVGSSIPKTRSKSFGEVMKERYSSDQINGKIGKADSLEPVTDVYLHVIEEEPSPKSIFGKPKSASTPVQPLPTPIQLSLQRQPRVKRTVHHSTKSSGNDVEESEIDGSDFDSEEEWKWDRVLAELDSDSVRRSDSNNEAIQED